MDLGTQRTYVRNIQPAKCYHAPVLLRCLNRSLSCVPTRTDKHAVLALLAPYLTKEIIATTLQWCVYIETSTNEWLDDVKVGEVMLPELAYKVGELWFWIGDAHVCIKVSPA